MIGQLDTIEGTVVDLTDVMEAVDEDTRRKLKDGANAVTADRLAMALLGMATPSVGLAVEKHLRVLMAESSNSVSCGWLFKGWALTLAGMAGFEAVRNVTDMFREWEQYDLVGGSCSGGLGYVAAKVMGRRCAMEHEIKWGDILMAAEAESACVLGECFYTTRYCVIHGRGACTPFGQGSGRMVSVTHTPGAVSYMCGDEKENRRGAV